jgi:hypothetical protein
MSMNCYQNGHSSAIFIKKKCTSLQNITLLFQTTFHLQVAKHYVIKLVGDLLQFGGFLLRFLPPRYNWNIVESGIKHH